MRWISVWVLIITAFAFWIVPDKNIWFISGCVVVALASLGVMRYFPPNEDNKPIKLPKWLENTKNIMFYTVATLIGVLWVGSIIFAIIKG